MIEVHSSRILQYLRALLIGLAVIYALQIWSPLRLNTDGIAYLAKAAAIVDGRELPYAEWSLPPGYQYLIAALDMMGLGATWVFIALNCVFLGIGLVAGYRLFRAEFQHSVVTSTILCCMVLLSFVMVKHVVLPVPEMAFFGVGLLSLWILSLARRASGPRRWNLYALAGLLIILATTLRVIGIALIPALAWSLWTSFRRLTPSHGSNTAFLRKMIAVIILGALLVTTFLLLTQSFYLDQLYNLYSDHGLFNNIRFMVLVRLEEWGEIGANVPVSQVPFPAAWPFRMLGLVVIGAVIAGAVLKRRAWSESELYAAAYVLILCVYPGHATRYWIPILPLLLGWAALLVTGLERYRWMRAVAVLYLAGYVLVGFGALWYTSRITFSGSSFPESYGGGSLEGTYRAAFEGRPAPDGIDEDAKDSTAVQVLRRYEPRAPESVR